MSYVPVATVVAEPQDSRKASTAALEFRTLKSYVADVVLPLIATKFGPAGGIMTGQIVSTNAVPLEIHNDTSYIHSYNTAASVLTGSIVFGAGGFVALSAGAGAVGVLLAKAGNSINFDGGAFYPSANAQLGSTGTARWGAYYGSTANFSGAVTAASFSGDGSALTGVPGATLTGGAIVSALGYTPYNAANPSGYQTAAGSVANATNASNTATATKANTLAQNGSGAGMTFNYSAGAGFQPNWIWGSNDGLNYYVWSPANLTVANAGNANVAGIAGSAGVVSNPLSNGYGTRTVSTSAPSGGSNGDVWYQY